MKNFLSILALLGAIASGALFVMIGQQKEQLLAERDSLQAQVASERSRAGRFEGEVTESRTRLAARETELEDAKARGITLEARVNQLTRDLNNARATIASSEQSQKALQGEMAELRRRLIEAQANLEGVSPDRIRAAEDKVRELEAQLAARSGAPGSTAETQPPPVATSVATVGPRSAFVVLNAGSGSGLRAGQAVALERDGEIIARGSVTELRENYSVASIAAGSLVKAPRQGDRVVTLN